NNYCFPQSDARNPSFAYRVVVAGASEGTFPLLIDRARHLPDPRFEPDVFASIRGCCAEGLLLSGIEPVHVIGDTTFERELRLINKRAANFFQIGFGEIL